MKKSALIRSIIFLAIINIPTIGMAASKSHVHPAWTWIYDNMLFCFAGIIFIAVLAGLWTVMYAMLMANYQSIGIQQYDPSNATPSVSPLTKIYNKLSGLVPIEKEADLMLDHDYDGIKELDNSLPPWWLYGFYISIVVAIGYLYVYQLSDIGLTQDEEYVLEMEKGEAARDAFAARQANNIDEKNLIALIDNASLNMGMISFKTNCSACHGQEGQGGVGPNLTDKYWIHGGSTASIYKTIKYGVPEKGMIAWKAQMQPLTIHKIASYIQSIQGTNPPNPKKAQGEIYNGAVTSTTK